MSPITYTFILRDVDVSPSDPVTAIAAPTASLTASENGHPLPNIRFWAGYLACALLICAFLAVAYLGNEAAREQREKTSQPIKKSDEAKNFRGSVEKLAEGAVTTIAPPPPAYIASMKKSVAQNANNAPSEDEALAHITRGNTLKNQCL
ncbi:hypothetical protein K438DRAFT_1958984 [Mycena galopus ATCC 62051]|nr:hypothetical protein K438DRAFT_1958984 [Mycena galopus ATCC 62051]